MQGGAGLCRRPGPSWTATALGSGLSYGRGPGRRRRPTPPAFDPERYRWLVIPDVALQKARLVRLHLAGRADCWSDNSYGFAAERPEGGDRTRLPDRRNRTLRSEAAETRLKGRGPEVLKRDFPLAAEVMMRRLGTRPGGPARGLHENRERFLGDPPKIAIFVE